MRRAYYNVSGLNEDTPKEVREAVRNTLLDEIREFYPTKYDRISEARFKDTYSERYKQASLFIEHTGIIFSTDPNKPFITSSSGQERGDKVRSRLEKDIPHLKLSRN